MKVFERSRAAPPAAPTARRQAEPDRRSEAAPPLVLVAVWFALTATLGEWSVLETRALLGSIVRHSHHGVWMAPLVNLLAFMLAALGFRLAQILSPRLILLPVVTFCFAFLAWCSLRGLALRVHTFAWVLLSAGLAVVVARWAGSHPERFVAMLRRTVRWQAVAVPLLALAPPGHKFLSERLAEAHLPPAAAGAPNVLLLVMDTVRAKGLSAYGYHRQTSPMLERLARRGVKFDRAVSTAPWTLPSHASMFTGRRPFEMSADWERRLDQAHPTLAELLAERGYRTAGFVANVNYCGRRTGLNRGFVHFEDYRLSVWTVLDSSYLTRPALAWAKEIFGRQRPRKQVRAADQINEALLCWLDNRADRPFFAFLNYIDAHDPYIPPPPWDKRFGDKQPRNPKVDAERSYPLEEFAALGAAYDRCIAYLDHQIGELLDQLDERGLLDNTIVIVTSDHGEQLGEHGFVDHGNSLYRPLLHVPLIISYPKRIPQGRSVEAPVSLLNLGATVVDLAGLGGEARFPGSSLARYWIRPGGAAEPIVSEVRFARGNPDRYPISKGDMRSIIVDGYHYIRRGDGQEELYDFMNDHEERRNLGRAAQARRQLRRCRDELKASDRS